MLMDLLSEADKDPLPVPSLAMGATATNTVHNALHDICVIASEIDEPPRDTDPNCHGAPMVLLASFPYPHAEYYGLKRLAVYDKVCQSGDGSGEFAMCTEAREEHHDGFREPNRFWGTYAGYQNAEERTTVLCEMLDRYSYKCARIVGPFVPKEHRGYRRSEG